jgi:hypothetical protein
MILSCKVKLSEIQAEGKKFNWIRPKCPRCSLNVRSQGYIRRFFKSIVEAVFIKKWKCHHCKLVITCRPEEFWRRYQEPSDQIFEILKYRIKNLSWPPWTTRQRGGHWMNKLIKKAKINLMLKECMLETIHLFQQKKLTIF